MIASWWDSVLHAGWMAGIVGVLGLLSARVLTRRAAASLRVAVLAIALVKFLIPPFVELPTGLFSWVEIESVARPESATAGVAELLPLGNPLGGTSDVAKAEVTADRAIAAAEPSPVSSPASVDWLAIGFAVWLLGAGIVAVRFAWQGWELARLQRGPRESVDRSIAQQARSLWTRMSRRRTPDLLVCERASVPYCFGVLRPTVVLPAEVVRRSNREQQRTVLAHELVHLAHRDPLLNLLQTVVLVLWWFHPIAWWVASALRQAQEDRCDDAVVASGLAEEEAYCDTLLTVASWSRGMTSARPVFAMAPAEHELGRRFRRILDSRTRSQTMTPLQVFFVPAVALALLPGIHSTVASAHPGLGDPPPATSAGTTATIPVAVPTLVPGSPQDVDVEVFVGPAPTPTDAADSVARGLRWLAAHSHSDDAVANDLVPTALKLLSYLGAGHTTQFGPHAGTVSALTQQLRRAVRASEEAGVTRGRAIAALALSECDYLSGTADARSEVQSVLSQIEAAVAKAPEAIDVDRAFWAAYAWLAPQGPDSARSPSTFPALLRQVPLDPAARAGQLGAMSTAQARAAAVFLRILGGGNPRADEALKAASEQVAANVDRDDALLSFLGSHVVWQISGTPWSKWKNEVFDPLVKSQETIGDDAGTWEGEADSEADRLTDTALRVLTLEVQYRYAKLLSGED